MAWYIAAFYQIHMPVSYCKFYVFFRLCLNNNGVYCNVMFPSLVCCSHDLKHSQINYNKINLHRQLKTFHVHMLVQLSFSQVGIPVLLFF